VFYQWTDEWTSVTSFLYIVSVSQLAFCRRCLEVLPIKLADEKLFGEVTANCNRVVHSLLAPTSQASQQYKLQKLRCNCALPTRILSAVLFNVRCISTAMFCRITLNTVCFNQLCIVLRFDNCIINEVSSYLSIQYPVSNLLLKDKMEDT